MQLNDAQNAFINHSCEFIRLLAPAGAGETASLLYRCVKFVKDDPSRHSLIVTFTRVARAVLQERINNDAAFLSYLVKKLTDKATDDIYFAINTCDLSFMTANSIYVLDANDKIWPNINAKEEDELESERRLFYVATTRAREKLIFSYSVNVHSGWVAPSPYLDEMGLLQKGEANDF